MIASIRQIIRGDDQPPPTGSSEVPTARGGDGVLRLDPSMLVIEPAASPPPVTPPASSSRPEPAAHSEPTLATQPAAGATATAPASVGALLKLVGKSVPPSGGGITVEAMVREALRPVLLTWLDAHLPSIVERVVRVEVERLLNRD